MKDRRVKRLRAADAERAVRAIDEIKGENPGLDYMRQFLSREANVLIAASDGDAPTGYLIAYLLDRVDADRQMLCIYEIEVSESHRRTGIARAMINSLKDLCRQLDASKAWVITNRSNRAAVQLYSSTGAHCEPAGDEIMFVWNAEQWTS
ncbi:MAG: GNAT family N-acetyltransferase [Myxococcales bacterium]|nr:GNAT family N-acetyltransferase [Myxococcales bacterium]